MASTFPGSIDNFTDPLANSSLSSPSHAGQHSDLNDAVEKIETYMGLVKVIPTSVSSAGGTAATLNSTTGNVTVGTGNTSVTVTCFSSLYDNYKIMYTGGIGSTTGTLELNLAGVTTGYFGGLFATNFSTGAFIGGGDNNTARWRNVGWCATLHAILHVDIYGPAVSGQRTAISAYGGFNSNGYGMFHGEVTSTAVSNGFTITPSSGTITGGTIRVYGYRN